MSGVMGGFAIYYIDVPDRQWFATYLIGAFYLVVIALTVRAARHQLRRAKWLHTNVHTFDAKQQTYTRNGTIYRNFDPHSKIIIHAEERRSGKSTYTVYIMQLKTSNKPRIVIDSSTNRFEMLCVGDMIAGHLGAELHFEPLPKKKGLFGL